MEGKHSCRQVLFHRYARPAATLLTVFLFACEPQQEAARDRELDEYAGGWVIDRDVFDPFADGADWIEGTRASVQYYRKIDDLIAARGVVIKQLNSLRGDETASASDIAEFESLLVGLDQEVSQIPLEKLRERVAGTPMYASDDANISYLYEISRRTGENTDRGLATADLCQELTFSLGNQPAKERDRRLEKALIYCGEALDILAVSKNPEGRKRSREVFSLLFMRWQDLKRPLHTFPYTERMISYFEPHELELQLGLVTFSHSRKVQGLHDSLGSEEEARATARLRYLLAKELGNKKEMGLALLAQGASWERQADHAEAAKSYGEARDLLAFVGYLEFSVPLAALLNAYDGKQTEADLRAAMAEAEAKEDRAAEASAHEALALLLTRQERAKEAVEASRLMLEAARKASDKSLVARALSLTSSQTGSAGDRVESVSRLSEAAQIYNELGDADGEASVLLVLAGADLSNLATHLAGADLGNLANHHARAFALLPAVGDPRLKAVLHQMKALQDHNNGDFASMSANAAQCRDYWASIGAREQVAHCEIVIAEAETRAGNNEVACEHLATAEKIFAGLGMPRRAAMQTGKAEKLGCAE